MTPLFNPNQNNIGNTTTVSSNYTVTATDNTIEVDTSGGNVTVTLLNPVDKPVGTQIRVKKITTDTNAMIIATPTGLIDGQTTITTNSTVKPSYTLETDGTNYIKV